MSRARTESLVWALASPASTHIRRLDHQAVVYDERSGDTHLLEAHAADLLARLSEAGPQAEDDLAERFEPGQLDILLRQLQDLGLVKSTPR